MYELKDCGQWVELWLDGEELISGEPGATIDELIHRYEVMADEFELSLESLEEF